MGSIYPFRIYPQGLHAPLVQHVYLLLFWWASGGTAATVFASIILVPLSDICLFGILCLPGFLLGGFFLIYSYVKGQQGQDNINHDAHLYGAIFGIVCILLLSPASAGMFLEQILSYRPF